MAGPGPKRPFSTPKRPAAPANKRTSSVKKNTSILSFFKKTDGPQSTQSRITQFGVKVPRAENKGDGVGHSDRAEDTPFEALFVEDRRRPSKNLVDIRENGQLKARQADPVKPNSSMDDLFDGSDNLKENDVTRFNENGGSLKRRRVDSPPRRQQKEQRGPFIDESDSEEEDGYANIPLSADAKPEKKIPSQPTPSDPPSLVREATSNFKPGAVADDFEDIEDDELEGEDFMERPWVEPGEDVIDDNNEPLSDGPACPICQTSIAGLSDSVCWLLQKLIQQTI